MNHQELNTTSLWKILEVSRNLSMPLSLEAVLKQVVETALEVLDAERGSVFLFHPASDELRTQVATGRAEIRVPLTKGIVGECALNRKVVNVTDCYQDARFNSEVDRQSGFKTQSLLAIPLVGLDDNLVGVLELINKRDSAFDKLDEQLGSLLASQCAVALQRAQLFEDRLVREQQDRDLCIAREIQQRILPQKMPAFDNYEIAGWNQSADATGGDIFDAFPTSETSGFFLLADATGHGIGPALSVTQVRSMFRIATTLGFDLGTQLEAVNAQLTHDLAANRFVTAFIGTLNCQSHILEYFSAGQAPLLAYSASSRSWTTREATTIPLGITTKISSTAPEKIPMEPGDIFAVFSDGFFEFPNTDNQLFGEKRVQETIDSNRGCSLNEILLKLRANIEEFAGGASQSDDMTAILIRRLEKKTLCENQ